MEALSSYIDHTLLKSTAQFDEIRKICQEAIDYQMAAVCIPPFYLNFAHPILKNHTPALCTVISFPFGYDHTSSKLEHIKSCIKAGADEIDFVVNVAAVKNGVWDHVDNEIETIASLIKSHGKTSKMIFETCYLEDEEIIELCKLCNTHKIDFAKTSTGFGSHGATIEDIKLMRQHLIKEVKIKASGGIRTREKAVAMIEAGADRIGTSSGLTIINS